MSAPDRSDAAAGCREREVRDEDGVIDVGEELPETVETLLELVFFLIFTSAPLLEENLLG
jgi:hypothetical protein